MTKREQKEQREQAWEEYLAIQEPAWEEYQAKCKEIDEQ